MSFEDDMTVIQRYTSIPFADVVAELEAADAYVQLAWLNTCVDLLNERLTVMYATAYADYKGELTDIRLVLPEDGE
jgi:hypothetical protein